MKKRKLVEPEMAINPKSLVRVTTMNHIVEIQYLEKVNKQAHIRKLDSETYVDLKTGEIREFERTENRSEGENSLRKTFNKLRELVRTNFNGSANELFVTLTYRGELQTNDSKIVYGDFKKFIMRLKYKYRDLTTIDYINVLEPHESGNFHMHAFIRFNDLDSIYIPNNEFAEIWGNGWVTVRSLRTVDDMGAYVTAYLTDIEVSKDCKDNGQFVEKEVQGQKKKFVKGARLIFYPPGVNIYRKSKGIIEPTKEHMTYEKAKKKLGAATPNFRYGIELIDNENDFKNTLIKEQYNLKR